MHRYHKAAFIRALVFTIRKTIYIYVRVCKLRTSLNYRFLGPRTFSLSLSGADNYNFTLRLAISIRFGVRAGSLFIAERAPANKAAAGYTDRHTHNAKGGNRLFDDVWTLTFLSAAQMLCVCSKKRGQRQRRPERSDKRMNDDCSGYAEKRERAIV